MSNPNKHRGSSVPNLADLLAVNRTSVVASGPTDIQPGETPSHWAARIAIQEQP